MGNIDDVKYPLNDVTLFITDAIQAGAQNMRQLLAVLARCGCQRVGEFTLDGFRMALGAFSQSRQGQQAAMAST